MGSLKLSGQVALNVTKRLCSNTSFPVSSRNACPVFYKSSKDLGKFREFKEITIPTPWGHIAAIWWGPQDRRPILALHGWQDNAYTWRPLMELLPRDVAVLAIDFPGHGKSSRYPHGMFYHSPDNLVNIRRVVKYFGWDSVSLMGHSMGAISSFTYAACFPNQTELCILLDNIKPITTRRKCSVEHLGKTADDLLLSDSRVMTDSEPPSYCEEELIERMVKGGTMSVTKETAPILLERGAVQSAADSSKHYYIRDSRLKYGLTLGLVDEDVNIMAENISQPMLAIKFENGPYFEPKEKYHNLVKLLQTNNKDFEFHTVPGMHHSHLVEPNFIAPIITNFLQKYHKPC